MSIKEIVLLKLKNNIRSMLLRKGANFYFEHREYYLKLDGPPFTGAKKVNILFENRDMECGDHKIREFDNGFIKYNSQTGDIILSVEIEDNNNHFKTTFTYLYSLDDLVERARIFYNYYDEETSSVSHKNPKDKIVSFYYVNDYIDESRVGHHFGDIFALDCCITTNCGNFIYDCVVNLCSGDSKHLKDESKREIVDLYHGKSRIVKMELNKKTE